MSTPDAHTLESGFVISDDMAALPLSRNAAFIQFSLIGLCRQGSANLNIWGETYHIEPDSLLVLFPQQDVTLIDHSPDFAITYFIVPDTLFHDLISMMRCFAPHFFFFMHKHYTFRLNQEEQVFFLSYCKQFGKRIASADSEMRREQVLYTLAPLYMDIYQYYKELVQHTELHPNQRQEELTYEFFRLVDLHHLTHKDVAFYADKMHITPTYLTIVIKETTGLSAKEWLMRYLTQKIKSKLRNPHMTIQQIALELNFPTQTAMNRFFRNYTGRSLSEYRKSTTFQ